MNSLNIQQKNNDDKYHLSFVEEGIMDEAYQNWTGGRMEIFIDAEAFNIDEVRFFSLKNKDWDEFREKYDGESVDEATLKRVKSIIKEKFHSIPK